MPRLSRGLQATARALCAWILVAAPLGGQSEPWFTDVTQEAGVDFVHFNGMSGRLYYLEVVGSGGALFDVDNDGDLDLYLVQSAMLGADLEPSQATFPWKGPEPPRDRLLRNEWVETGQLRFRDITENSRLDSRGYGIGVAAGDYDGDGYVDLYVLNHGANELWRNLGDGTFRNTTRQAGVADERWSASASWTDYDGDGHLDLFVVNYLHYNLITHKTCLTERGEPDYCLPSAYQPVADTLFRNRGDGTFEDVTREVGIAAAPANGLGVIAADLNGDDRLDFYVANDLMDNALWLQQPDGTFVDDGVLVGVAVNREGKAEASMGVTTGDADNDGDLDLFMTHFRRETNTFYRAQGDGFFDDVTSRVELGQPSWEYTAFGTGFLDVDNDGWLDLVTANGAVTFPAGGDRSGGFPLDEINQLFRGGPSGFEEITSAAGPAFAASHVSRGALVGDLDNDGDPDLVFTNNSGPARILRNDVGQKRRWVGLDLRRASQTDHGATVEAVLEGGGRLLRRAHTDGGYASSNDPRVLVGLGDRPAPVRFEVQWSDGTRESFPGSAAPPGRYSVLTRGTGAGLGARSGSEPK